MMNQVLSNLKDVSIAPMMGITDQHFRYFFRLLSKKVTLYTEMIVAQALVYGNPDKLLAYHQSEQPVVLQLGGSCPKLLANCARIGEDAGYCAVNLNVGCPSTRVQAGEFGVCLMSKPKLVAECVAAMQDVCELPITVKTRLGVDEHESYEFVYEFVQTVAAAGCQTFIIHARKAWLHGLNPKQNRTVPPLNYEMVYQLQRDFPELYFILNGGLNSLDVAKQHAYNLDGVMFGRLAYEQPLLFQEIDSWYEAEQLIYVNLEDILMNYFSYARQAMKHGHKLTSILRPLMNIFHGQMGAKQWRYAVTKQENIDELIMLFKSLSSRQVAA